MSSFMTSISVSEDLPPMARLACFLGLDLGMDDAVPQYVPVVVLEPLTILQVEAMSAQAPDGAPDGGPDGYGCLSPIQTLQTQTVHHCRGHAGVSEEVPAGAINLPAASRLAGGWDRPA